MASEMQILVQGFALGLDDLRSVLTEHGVVLDLNGLQGVHTPAKYRSLFWRPGRCTYCKVSCSTLMTCKVYLFQQGLILYLVCLGGVILDLEDLRGVLTREMCRSLTTCKMYLLVQGVVLYLGGLGGALTQARCRSRL